MSNFVHLHVHTEYSLLDGLPKIGKLLTNVKNMGMDSVAITDHGVLYGAAEFYKISQKEGVRPIIGMEAYNTNIDHTLKGEGRKVESYHLLLLAKDEDGYKNLMKLTSIAHVEGYYYRPRFDKETLKRHAKGLICTSACPAGELADKLISEDYDGAKKVAAWFLDLFGEDYYLEVQRHEYEKYLDKAENPEIRAELSKMARSEELINDGVRKLSRELGIPIVATNDAHYVLKEDSVAQDVLVCVATGKNVSEVNRLRFIDSPTYYVRPEDEMKSLFPDLPDAIDNTRKVADKCSFTISTFGKWFFPKFPIPGDKDPNLYIRELATKNLKEKIKGAGKIEEDRLNYELGIICQKGYAPYFLIVMDMVNWAQEKGIITNTRGSAAGSLVSYVLGITTVNPLTYGLPFERFLNPYRPSPPDIDLDVSDDRREEIIEYITSKYGKEKVAQVCTFGRMLARAAVRDVARVLGYPYAVGDRISKLIPPPKQGFPIDIPKALEITPQLKDLYDSDPDSKKILDLAHQVEGSARHLSVHAAGLVVAPKEMTEFSPIQLEPSGSRVITQYEMHACEDVGLIKFDILGIRNLSILGAAVDIVAKTRDKRIDPRTIPLDDKKTFDMLARGETMGVFQLSSAGMTKYLKDLKPSRIEDLMVMVALYRPGPIQVIPDYIARKKDQRLIKYLDPRMKKFLDKSFGLIVYQDDLLFCAIELAGYTWEEADKFRKAVGKKIPEEMAAQKEKFINGIITNGQSKEFAEQLWKLFEPFQAYGFNKAHAASYGMVAYQTAYMKANFPVEYMCALMTAESNDTDKVSTAVNECKRIGIKILPPDINESGVGFSIVDDKESLDARAIRFGLSAIKNVGNAAIESILAARNDRKFVSFADFCARVDARKVNKKVLESLIKVGAMSVFGSRAGLLSVEDEYRQKVKPKGMEGQQDLFGEEEKKVETIEVTKVATQVPEFSEDEQQLFERDLLGFSLSARPVGELLGELVNFATHKIFELTPDASVGEVVKVAGVVREVRVIVTKKTGAEMAFVKVQDDTGTIDLVIFPKIYSQTRSLWSEYKPVLIEGKVDSRDDELSILAEKVKTPESDNLREEDNLFIKVPKNTNIDQLRNLKNLLVEHPGNQKVTLVFEKEGGVGNRITLPFGINWDESLSHLINALLEGEIASGVQ